MNETIYTETGYFPTQIIENEEYLNGHYLMAEPDKYSCEEKSVIMSDGTSLIRCYMYYDNSFPFDELLLDIRDDGRIVIMPINLYPYLDEIHNQFENKFGPRRFSKITLIEDEDYKTPTIYIEYVISKS